ncbi:scavenger receptor cysteine-rich type 1 protein M130-like isoform X1 [Betta splendens]|uniref:Soluble scavenger receptor cysteine-rich domain-containing protein SSC5D n=1 Tax=Betta splendens TaxID=158456 RepID=A0A9W2XLP6_BETSP|nr:scavenger receptor cysteine-rich type 1 protein M130-like isoform X1 [Betta splendens]XP_055362528.1 scavenger receptor cysteine-rich type 1 protein M130-like isoform X1 [Betta splendens]XP_055362529.1 scavenger receptor cysteine-rich type 1 protein M130-like isoform X1 [Betta splendens]XP_055362530.1 scavenger receptor cysteine-rich type 1 protein M130-like isoform X1 [Betta splendens]XP_055362531.1 scavenger receptor cysteine-rich type 1 protein M130-like isoform X1 [Betta splendens]
MSFLPAEKLVLVLYLTIVLLILSTLTDAGVVCSECDKIRLVGPSRCSGTVEVSHNGSWGTVCDDHWSLHSAAVVCREVDCGSVLEAKMDAFFGEGKEMIWLDDVQCMGDESSILKCPHNPFGLNDCRHAEDAGVVCSETLRVVNGSNRCNGRVEVFYNERWRRVCSSDWGKEEAEILCRELNCGSPDNATAAQTFGEPHDLPGVKTNCFGNESSFSQCTFQEFKEGCIDATVFCTNNKPVRLKNGTHRCSGRVEVYHNGQWGTVCDDRWDMQEAAVVCRQMNCGNPIAVKDQAHFGKGQDQMWLDDIDCFGYENGLIDCPHRGLGQHDCDHSEDAGVICSENVRLVGGPNLCSGRLEVFHNDKWGRICSHNWSSKEAAMVCKELNCGTPKRTQESFGAGSSELRIYTSTCSESVSSMAQCTLQQHSGTCNSVSVSCAELKLVNGTDRCSGRVEILHNNRWGTVCGNDFDMRDAQVVCRTIDCGSPLTIKHNAFFGKGEAQIWLEDVNCSGNETSLVHCQHRSFGESNCGHGEDVGVICSDSIRLLNGTDHCSGRVEVNYNGQWSPTYNVNWGMNEARVVCREINCGDPVQAAGSFVESGDLRGHKISCGGGERSLRQCTLGDYVRTSSDQIQEATVQCSGNVKLSNGPTRCAGTVELYDEGQWGTLCSDTWDMKDATVVCRQLGCGKAHKISTKYESGNHISQTWVEQFECNGQEVVLSQCRQRPLQDRDRTRNTTSLASVVCTENLEVRLINGENECSGRVEVRHGADWKTVCDTDWTMKKAEVVCELLECGHAVNATSATSQGNGPAVDSKDSCFDNVTALQQCSVKGFTAGTCGHEQNAGVFCVAQLRLVSNFSQCAGRVEILHKGQWGTVCDDEWEMSDANVVCKQLGCGHAVLAPTSAHFGEGTGPIWLDDVGCSGEEAALTHCKHLGIGENNCEHGEDAGAICLSSLEKPQITLSPGPEVNWGDKVEITCTIVTEHLGGTENLGGTFVLRKTQDSAKLERFSEHEAVTFIFCKVDFNHTGSYFCEYHKKLPNQVISYPEGNTVDLSVTVKLEKPSISLTSPQAMVIYSPDKISVTQGSSFSITCLMHSTYGKGVFHLMRSDKQTSETQPAFTHLIFSQANFDFPTIGYELQGEYTCVYSFNISSSPFFSAPSKTLQVTVQASSSSTVGGVVGGLVVLLVVLVIGYLVWRNKWCFAGTTIQFENRLAAANKSSNGRHSTEYNNQDASNTDESIPEDLAGRVCYELEPLVCTGHK